MVSSQKRLATGPERLPKLSERVEQSWRFAATTRRSSPTICIMSLATVLVRVRHTRRVLPGMDDVVDDFIHPRTMLHLGEHERAIAPHPL
jgi:hypothetical protein